MSDSGGPSLNPGPPITPALFTSVWSPPSSSQTRSTAAWQEASLVTSQAREIPPAPIACASRIPSSTASWEMSARASVIPSSARQRAIPRPIFPPAPVMRATLPSSPLGRSSRSDMGLFFASAESGHGVARGDPIFVHLQRFENARCADVGGHLKNNLQDLLLFGPIIVGGGEVGAKL